MARKIALKLLPVLLGQMFKMITPELLKELADKVLDAIENAITKSENKIDDAMLPIIFSIRQAFDIPDNDAR